MKLYLAGPMTGIENWNFPAFNQATERLRAQGHEVINPAENEGDPDILTWADFIRIDIGHVLDVDAVAVLPGWRQSRGARLETTIADALGLPILDAATLEPISETILEEAQRIVYGDREGAYGHPADDFGRTARMWGAILGADVTAKQAALCMAAVKISRECNKPGRDNLVDLAGYAAVAARIQRRADGLE